MNFTQLQKTFNFSNEFDISKSNAKTTHDFHLWNKNGSQIEKVQKNVR